jgi:hypothetical protein
MVGKKIHAKIGRLDGEESRGEVEKGGVRRKVESLERWRV